MTKNTLFFTATLAMFAIGCSGDDEATKTGSGDTGGDTDTTDTTDTTVTAPEVFDNSTLGQPSCDGSNVEFAYDFLGEAFGGMVDIADTSNDPNWNESHTLDAEGYVDAQLTELGTPPIPVGVGINDFGDQIGSVFTCGAHFDDVNVMTYIARAYDFDTGELSDCAAWGDDPNGFIDGGDYIINARPDEAEITSGNCRVVAAAK